MTPASLQFLKAMCVVATGAMVLAACGNNPTTSTNLAADQTLKFPILDDFGTLDPAIADAETDQEIQQNMFNGMTKFDNNLNVVPDIASKMPDVSADLLTYTFHLRNDVTFSNGDKVTSKDVLYSWNRAAALQGPYASNLGAITGFSDVAKYTKTIKPKKTADATAKAAFNTAIEAGLSANDARFKMKGLTAPDDSTVVAKLDATAGWFLSAIA